MIYSSHASAINGAMQSALQDSAEATLEMKGHYQTGKLSLDYSVSGNAEQNSQLLIAVVQKQVVNNVLRGENEGRKLTNVQIVRDLQQFELKKNMHGSVKINLPADFNTQEWELIGLVQNPETGVIKAAARALLNPA